MTVKKKLIALSFIAGLTAPLLAAPANASESFELPETLKVAPLVAEAAPVTATSAVKLNYERPSVSTTPATVVEAPVEAVQPTKSEAASTASESTRLAVTQPVAVPVAQSLIQPASASVPQAVAPVSGNAVVNAAKAQLGVVQDCTALVTKSLAAVGISHHGWPVSYLALGRVVSAAEALPGDVIYYANGGAGVAHVAINLGGGKAVHGGFNGNQTVIFSVNVGSGPVYIRVGG